MRVFFFLLVLTTACSSQAIAQSQSFQISPGTKVKIENQFGRITVKSNSESNSIELKRIGAGSLDSKNKKNVLTIRTKSESRLDLEVTAPHFADLELVTSTGQLTILGEFARVTAKSSTGTIYTDTEFENLDYKLLWTASYPRYMSDPKLEKIREKNAGKFQISGYAVKAEDSESDRREVELRTERGIILINVPPSQVPSNLLPKKMTKAAETLLKSGDGPIVNAIVRAAPDLVGDDFVFEKRRRLDPVLIQGKRRRVVNATVKRVNVQVVDRFNRALDGLTAADFEVSERGETREVVRVETSEEPFNLLLLMDVSGSVRDYVDFIRKAGRSFVQTVGEQDKISIVVFNDDVQVLTGFTSDRAQLSDSLDTFDAGGGTALYDAIGFGLVETLRPLRGQRTAIVILSDGDDNRSFLSIDPLIGALQESGALVYPMYVPSSLLASSGDFQKKDELDPLRDRYLSNNLSSKAQKEGKLLANVSGGVYFPISKLSELERAYGDIVKQLRTSYSITFRSGDTNGASFGARLRVRVKKDNAFVKIGPVTAVTAQE